MSLKKTLVAGVVAALAAGTALMGPAAATDSGAGDQGCTPGYWKNHADSWQEYSPTTMLSSDLRPFDGVSGPYFALGSFPDATFMQALHFKGGPGLSGAYEILMRASTAAMLNAAHDDVAYPWKRFSQPNLIKAINAALASGDRATMIALATQLDNANNLGCPLN